MRIFGIDPGLRLTGYGVIDYHPLRPTLIDGGVIRLDDTSSIPQRLVVLETDLVGLFQQHKPDLCAVEQLYSHYAHPRTAILMGHARGVILLVAQRFKHATTGHGHASKPQMQRAIGAIFKLPSVPDPPDVADALAVALCAGRHVNLTPTLVPARKRSTVARKPSLFTTKS
jgi:crossover junction endodeoxyribonuclease RuvC